MATPKPRDLMTVVVPRVLDLRAEFEAQLRAVSRVEEQLRKTRAGKDPSNGDLAEVLRRELAECSPTTPTSGTSSWALAADNETPVPFAGS